jgi:hypothetical protein
MSGADRHDGYATAAAVVVCMAVALSAAAAMGSSVAELRLARGDLRRIQAQYGLGGASMQALAALGRAPETTRLRWTMATDAGPVAVLAEPETAKLPLAAAAALEDGDLRGLGASNPATLRARLEALVTARHGSMAEIAGGDAGLGWRRCAASAVSRLGQASRLAVTPAVAPAATPEGGSGSFHAGEVWRVRVTLDGWTEDRILRLTGDPYQPAAVIERRFHRSEGETPCDALTAKG